MMVAKMGIGSNNKNKNRCNGELHMNSDGDGPERTGKAGVLHTPRAKWKQ
jgi:hypothetical protein